MCVLAFIVLPSVAGGLPARAQEGAQEASAAEGPYEVYFPRMDNTEPMVVERFVHDPHWRQWLLKDPKDGFFEHWPEDGTYLAQIRDNSALMVASPQWTVSGDFKIEVSGRHLAPDKKSLNALGLAFNGTEDWNNFYALMVAMGGKQHHWALVRFKDTRAKYLTNDGYRGGGASFNGGRAWNRLKISVIDGVITVFVNNKRLVNGQAEAEYYKDERMVGVVVTSYEFSNGLIAFDDFKLTRLYPGTPEYEEERALAELDD
jgi:hypothetical protein